MHNTDVDGRYRTGVAGIYPVTPDYFDVEIRKTHQGDKTWYDHKLNKLGWNYIESATKGHWLGDFDLVDEKYIQNLKVIVILIQKLLMPLHSCWIALELAVFMLVA